ncbi:MAG: neutral zinc metallopeptidase, partial [Candidatus Omnitrophica bacterium]|nr:neutral zinc metallopeptidase [Candidatus Omnitrophota bacterium]
MDWRGRRRSANVEDRRRMTPARGAVGGGLGTLVLVVLFLLMGGDPSTLLSMVETSPQVSSQQSAPRSPEEDQLAEFVSVVLAETEDVWNVLLPQQEGVQYRNPTLVLFSGAAQSACGYASAAMGPFYCPADEKVYIDLSFYDDLRKRHHAPGDFAQAYVIAHEIGHHVQKILGISDQVHAQRSRLSKADYNQLSVRLELQADFLAGVWAHHADRTAGILEPGDIQEAITAASAIGDDRLQREAQGYVVPD